MSSEWRRKTKFKPGGQVEVSVLDLSAGETVEVVVRREEKAESIWKRPGFGSARGQIKIQDDFDEPLADFGDYQ